MIVYSATVRAATDRLAWAYMTSRWSYIDLEVVVYSAVAGAIDHSLREVDAREVRGEVPEERSAQPRPAPRVHHLFRTKIFLHVRIPSLHVLYVLSLVKN